MDAFRAALGKPPKWGTEFRVEDARRVALREEVALGRHELLGSVSEAFREELDSHATGFLAPLIMEMSVTCGVRGHFRTASSWSTSPAWVSPETSTRK